VVAMALSIGLALILLFKIPEKLETSQITQES